MSTYKEINTAPSSEQEPLKPIVIEVDLEDVTSAAPVDETVVKDVVETKEVDAKSVEVVKPEKPEHVSRAQKRIKQLLADKAEAQAAADAARLETTELRKQLHEGTKASNTGLKSSLEATVQSLTQQMKTAMQNGESDLVIDLQDKLMDAKMELKGVTYEIKQADSFKEVQPSETQKSTVPEAALSWIEDHPTFKTDAYFYNSTITENNQLISEGYDPKSEDFYEELNKRLTPRFPKVFGAAEENSVSLRNKTDSSSVDFDADVKKTSPAKVRTTEQTVSGSSRSSANATPVRKSTSVTLTPEHIREAERSGITLETMAKRIAHIEANRRTDGYVSIMMQN